MFHQYLPCCLRSSHWFGVDDVTFCGSVHQSEFSNLDLDSDCDDSKGVVYRCYQGDNQMGLIHTHKDTHTHSPNVKMFNY